MGVGLRVWGLGFWGLGFRDAAPIMEGQMEEKIENEKETVMIKGFIGIGAAHPDPETSSLQELVLSRTTGAFWGLPHMNEGLWHGWSLCWCPPCS